MKNFFRNYFSGYDKQGGIGEMLAFAIPMVISSACDGVMTFTDRLFLSRIGPEQMNAALGGGVTMQMLTFFFTGLTGYSTALVAQYYGAGKNKESATASFQAILVTLAAWPLILMLKPLTVYFFDFAGLSQIQRFYQSQYIDILAWGAILSMMRYTLGCYFSGIGKTGIVMKATFLAMIVNVILDYILVFGKAGFPAMGIRGAAIATVSGSFCGLVLMVIRYFGKFNVVNFDVMKSFRYDRALMKKLIYYGTPAGLEMFLNFLSFFFMIAVFQSLGDVAATASTIMFNWDYISFIPLLGFEVSVTSLVGRYMGAGKTEVAYRSAISGAKMGIFYSAIILVLFLFIPGTLANVFHPATESGIFDAAFPFALKMIRIASLYVLFESIIIAFTGALRGAGDTHFVMFASTIANWFFLGVVFVVCRIFNATIVTGWLLIVLAYLTYCLIISGRFFRGKWRRIKVISQN